MGKVEATLRKSNPGASTKVLFINRSYWPDAEATGQLLTELCEDLAATFSVTVIAGQPNSNPSGESYRRRGVETRHGVRVQRVWHTRFAKRFLPGRIVNYLSFLWGAFWAAVWTMRPDVIVVETDPPLLCLIGWFLHRVRGSKLVVYLQDIHPDVGVALGKLPNGPLTRLLRGLMARTYRAADRVVVLSRDMKRRIIEWGISEERVECIPNWVDTRAVKPVKVLNHFREDHNLEGKFVVMYSGNLGLCQRLDDVIDAADRLRDRADLLFLLVGEGTLKPKLIEQVARRGLTNVRFLSYQPKARLAESLSAADVHLVPLDPLVAACLMPSKFYGVLASGTPMIAIGPADCELAELTNRHKVGVVCSPGHFDDLAESIEHLVSRPLELGKMGLRARRLAEDQFDRRHAIARFARVLDDTLGITAPDTHPALTLPQSAEPVSVGAE
jgi:glycosyltransferase involved in cell wall biosynthesis